MLKSVRFLAGVTFLTIVMFLAIGNANAMPIKWAPYLTEVRAFSDDLVVNGWQWQDYDNGSKFTGNPNLRGKSFSIDYNGSGPAYFAVFQTKETKKGVVTKERWGEVYYNKKHQLKVRWLKTPLNLDLGNLVVPAVDAGQALVETPPHVNTPVQEVQPPEITTGPLDQDDDGEDLLVADNTPDGHYEPPPDGNGDNGAASVPEPATLLLLGVGLIGLAAFGRKKFNQ